MSVHRLTDHVRIHGAVQQPGYVFELGPDEALPLRRVQGDGGQVIEIAQSQPATEQEAEAYFAARAALAAIEPEPEAPPAEAPSVPEPQKKTTRCRLTAEALVDGALRAPGYEFDLPDGERGPYTTARVGHDRIDVQNDSNRILGEQKDVPLYEVVEDDAAA